MEKVALEFSIFNIDRTAGTMLSYDVVKKYGNKGLQDDTLNLIFRECAVKKF